MGQQATVLHHPLDEAKSTPTLASPDELLSQLAGEEIDRLLAENGADSGADAADAGSASIADANAEPHAEAEAEQAATIDALHAVGAAGIVHEDLADYDSRTAPMPAPSEAAVPAPPPLPAAEVAHPGLPVPSPPDPPAPPLATAAIVEPEPEAFGVDEPLPLYLRPLEWLNAPLGACPECVREVLGKVAIVTLINAIAVLIYVMLLRQ